MSVWENSVVPPGLEAFTPLFPALKRRAIVSRPSGARIISILSHHVGQNPVLTHTPDARSTEWGAPFYRIILGKAAGLGKLPKAHIQPASAATSEISRDI